jgi:flagellar hook-length control protein FliK
MIYGTRAFSNSFSSLTSNQTTQVSGQQSQVPATQGSVSSTGVSSTNIPLVQQGNVQAVQATAFQSADLAQAGKPLKVDGDTTQISGIQVAQVSSGIGSKGAAGAAQSGSKDSNTGTDSGSKHSSDSGTSQSIFGTIQASAIDTKNTPVATQAEKTAVANQVASAVKQADENGRSQISLHLSPEDLGGINIKIVSQGGTLSLQITADNSHTGQLIASGMHELTQAMHDAGISMNKADVLFDSNGGSGASLGSGQQASSQQASSQQQGGDTSYKTPKWVSAMQNSSVISNTSNNQLSDNGTMSILA